MDGQTKERADKNVLQLLYIIAHEIIISNSVSEYTHGPWKVSDACALLMSCITEQESAKTCLALLFFISCKSNNYELSSGMVKWPN